MGVREVEQDGDSFDSKSETRYGSEHYLQLSRITFYFCLIVCFLLLAIVVGVFGWSLSNEAPPIAIVFAFASLGLTVLFSGVYVLAMSQLRTKLCGAIAMEKLKLSQDGGSLQQSDPMALEPKLFQPYPWFFVTMLATVASVISVSCMLLAQSYFERDGYQASTWLAAHSSFGLSQSHQDGMPGREPNAALSDPMKLLSLIRSPTILERLYASQEIRGLQELEGLADPIAYLQDGFDVTRFEETNHYCVTFHARKQSTAEAVLDRGIATLRAKLEEDDQRQRDEEYASLVKTNTKFQERYIEIWENVYSFMRENSVTGGVSHHVSMATGSPDSREYLLAATIDRLKAELNQV